MSETDDRMDVKEEDASVEKTEKTSSPKKSTSKSPVKKAESPKKKKEEVKDDEEEEEEETHLGVLDQPLIVEGKRHRETVQRLAVSSPLVVQHRKPEFKGQGTELGEIEYVHAQMDKEKGEELRGLYRACFGTRGAKAMIKRELKKFNGFDFGKESAEYKKKVDAVSKMTRTELDVCRRVLGLHRQQKKEDEATAIVDFLMKPSDSGRKAPVKKGKKRKSSTTEKKTKGVKKSKNEKSEEVVSSDNDDDEDESGEEEEEEQPKTPKKKVSESKKTPKKTPAKKTATPKKTSAKKSKKDDEDKEEESTKDSESSSVTSTDSSEDKPKDEEKKVVEVSNEDIIKKIDELLKTFDLTQVSMKQMVLAVSDSFPNSELSSRTGFIKEKIKDAIKQME